MLAGESQKLHHAPRLFITHANGAYLAFFDQLIQHFELGLNRHPVNRLAAGITFGIRVKLILAKHRHVALRPMQIEHIQVVGLQTRQAVVHCLADIRPVHAARATAYPLHAASGACHLAGQHKLVARLLFNPVAKYGFGLRHGFCTRRHRIHLGGIDKVNALRAGKIQLVFGVLLGVLVTKGHGAQRNFGDANAAVPEGGVIH